MFSRSLGDGAELRLLEERYAPDLYALIDANRVRLRRWFAWLDGTTTPDATLAYIRDANRQLADNRGYRAAIFLDTPDGWRLTGTAGMHPVNWQDRSTELAYWVGGQFEGRGLATRACRALCAHAFDAMRLHRVEIKVATGNERSHAVPRRLGFRAEGVARQAEWLYDHHEDLTIYAMLADEWRDAPDRAPRPAP